MQVGGVRVERQERRLGRARRATGGQGGQASIEGRACLLEGGPVRRLVVEVVAELGNYFGVGLRLEGLAVFHLPEARREAAHKSNRVGLGVGVASSTHGAKKGVAGVARGVWGWQVGLLTERPAAEAAATRTTLWLPPAPCPPHPHPPALRQHTPHPPGSP